MKTITDFTVFNCAWNDERARGYYNPPTILAYNGTEYVIGAGQTDNVSLFDESGTLLVLSVNSRYGYAGLGKLVDGEEESICFLRNSQDFDLLELNQDFFEYADINQAKILALYWGN